MRLFFLILATLAFSFPLAAQKNLEAIFNSSSNFNEIVERAETYFTDKHPDLPRFELTEGEHRDGEYVKFMRWQKFWSERLNADGTLGDISAAGKRKLQSSNANSRQLNPYANVAWTNISYENYIISQIGLGRTTSMGFHPTDANTFYVGAAIGGIWKTTDGGQNYTPLGDDLPFLAVSCIVVDQNNPNTIYIAVSDHVWYGPQGIGVYKSTNGGQTWNPTALSFDFSENKRIYWMEADPNDPSKIMVATQGGLYRTTNGFTTVTEINSLNCFHVRYRPGSSTDIYLSTSGGGFHKSTNGGVTFSLVTNLGNGKCNLDVTSLNNQIVYARAGEQFYKSTNAGATFTLQTGTIFGTSVFRVSPTDPDIIISGNFDTYRSDNGGVTFTPISQWLGNGGLPSIHVDQRNMFTNPLEPDAVYFCNDGGLYRYNITPGTFDNLCNGLLITQFYDIAVSQTDANVIGAGSQDNGNVFRDGNGNWTQYAGTGDGMNQEIDPTDASIRYWAYQNGGIRRYQNGGNSNIAPSGQNGNGAWETPFKLDPSNSSRLIIGYDKVYESLDRGSNWTEISGQLAGGSDMNELAIAPSNGERIYVTQGGNLFVRDETAGTWASKNLPNGGVSDIEVDFLNMDIVYVSTPGFSNGQKVFKSTDAGDTWTNISANLPNVSTGALELVEGTIGGVLVGTDAGVFYKDDQAQVWLEYGDLPNTRVEDIEIQYAAQLIRIGTHGRGVLEAPLNIQACVAGSPDEDNDSFCDFIDQCPSFDNNLIGTACDDSDPFSQGEVYTTACDCDNGAAFETYCGANGNGATVDWINNVSLNEIDHGSAQTGYSDFRAVTTPLIHGNSYPLEVSLNHVFTQDRVYVWVDYDRSGIFDLDERLELSFSSGQVASGTITVPIDAVAGAVTMRVRTTFFNRDEPCGGSAGEVEDYTVSLQCIPTSTNAQCGNALPLKFTAFTATAPGRGKVLLNWETTDEEDLSHFVVERSATGERFTDVAQVVANNRPGRHAYSFDDANVAGTEAFYRIRAIDQDEAVNFTPIQRVDWNPNESDEPQVFPNPVQNVLYVTLPSWTEQSANWEVIDVDGRQVLTGIRSASNLSINVDRLPVGSYVLRVNNGDREVTIPFVK